MQYPEYYVQPFHAYEEGNLNWLAAFEVESATYSMALRTFPGEGLSADQAQCRLRDGIHGALRVRILPVSAVGAAMGLAEGGADIILPAAACGQGVGACWTLGRVRWIPT